MRSRRHAAEGLAGVVALAVAAILAVTALHPPDGSQATPKAEAAPPLTPNTINQCRRGEVALTFDDGPGLYTVPMLDVLRSYQAKSTFFVLGSKVTAHPDLVRAMVADGHRVENHSWDHPHLSDLAVAQIHAQIADTQRAITKTGAPAPVMLRPPFGDTSPEVEAEAGEAGLRMVRWTYDTNDWRGRRSADITAGILANLAPGMVVLMHDGVRDAANTLAALPAIIEGLRGRGYCTARMR